MYTDQLADAFRFSICLLRSRIDGHAQRCSKSLFAATAAEEEEEEETICDDVERPSAIIVNVRGGDKQRFVCRAAEHHNQCLDRWHCCEHCCNHLTRCASCNESHCQQSPFVRSFTATMYRSAKASSHYHLNRHRPHTRATNGSLFFHLLHLVIQLILVSSSHGTDTLDELTQLHQINLVQKLNLHNVSYSGLSTDNTHSLSKAIYFYDDSSRNIRLNSADCQRAAKLISQGNDVTFVATVRQSKGNTGTLFAFTDGIQRVLEIQSSGRKKELRFQYRQHETVFSETFAVDLADDAWHKIALTISDVQLDLYIDCVHRFQRQILPIDKETLLNRRNLTLWLGQRGLHHFMFQGYMRDVRIVASSNGFRAQCPDLETACPTCGQFKALKELIFQLESTVKHLTEKVQALEKRMANVESSDCIAAKDCRVNGTIYPDGFTWRKNCDNCTCSAGKVTCTKIKCENSCKTGQRDACCPKCKKQCYQKGRGKMNEGEKFTDINYRKSKCNQCVCDQDGKLNCREIMTEKCPKLNCTAEKRFLPHGECCQICEGTDFCAIGHGCHRNAECRNLRTNYTCVCKLGYRGNGHTCEDVNECADQSLNMCHNAACVNTDGSFECRCNAGFVPIDARRCIDVDECSTKQHTCGENAHCINTPGHYQCKCNEGYEGDGRVCKPVCKHSCLNGGICVAPNTCSCRKGYYGHRCETDIDECELGLHQCPPNSKCVNKPGWYHCECDKGYEVPHEMADLLGVHDLGCQDVDECARPTLNTCPQGSKCINFDGGYLCECTNRAANGTEKSSSSDEKTTQTSVISDNRAICATCLVNGVERQHGERWTNDGDDHCTQCHCTAGIADCAPKKCDCSSPIDSGDSLCCPQCARDKVCVHHQESRVKVYQNGQRWNYDCHTCECMSGQIDCWSECPPTNCLNPIRLPGDCCFRCEDDPCQSAAVTKSRLGNVTTTTSTTTTSTTAMAGCRQPGMLYNSGEIVKLHSDKCTTCVCQDGRVCCSYSVSCSADNESNKLVRSSDAFNVSLDREPFMVADSKFSAANLHPNHYHHNQSPFGAIGHYIERFLGHLPNEEKDDDNNLLTPVRDKLKNGGNHDDSNGSHELTFSRDKIETQSPTNDDGDDGYNDESKSYSAATKAAKKVDEVAKKDDNDERKYEKSDLSIADWSHEIGNE